MLDFIDHYDNKLTLKSHFWCDNVKILSLCTEHCSRRQCVMLLNH